MKLHYNFDEISLVGWLVLGLILFSQSIFLFLSAKKSYRNAWIWGIIGLIQFPWPLIIFLLTNKKRKAS